MLAALSLPVSNGQVEGQVNRLKMIKRTSDLELNDDGIYAGRAQEKAAKEGWVFERMQGDTRLMRMLMHGEWDPEEFLVVPPGQAIGQSYKDDIVKAVGG